MREGTGNPEILSGRDGEWAKENDMLSGVLRVILTLAVANLACAPNCESRH
jgi:hypothetical protein